MIVEPAWIYGNHTRHHQPVWLNTLYEYPFYHFPEKLAIKDDRSAYTFRELFIATTVLAGQLIEQGIRKGDRVMVIAEKCAEMAIIGGAIWKTGAVYVPVDPSNPSARAAALFQSIEPALLIAPKPQSIQFDLPSDYPVIYYHEVADSVNKPMPEYLPIPEVNDKDLAYIIHTSGSTGKPKGVMIDHGSVVDYFYNHNQVLRFTGDSYCLSNAPFYFDVSIEDTFLPLSVGAAVYQYRGLPFGSIIRNLLLKEKITHLIAVSTILAIITGEGHQIDDLRNSALEMIMTGAEVCDVKVINAWKTVLPNARVINVYGPTETTIVCTAYVIEKADHTRKDFYPIGKPLQGVLTLLVDDNGNVIKDTGLQGELLVGGRQVMRGYWKDADATAKVLVKLGKDLYYKTGDICYYDDGGDLVFCGRNDDEIKLFGKRIHLLEVKNTLLADTRISNVAISSVNVNERPVLAAVITSYQIHTRDDLAAIKKHLQHQLPAYMVPEYLAVIPDPMLSPTGKNAEKQLLAILQEAIGKTTSEFYFFNDDHIFYPLLLQHE